MTERIQEFLRNRRSEGRDTEPCLVVDLEVVRDNYQTFAKALPDSRVFYAVKANPAPEVLALLASMVWALENPNEGIVEADEMDFDRLLEIQLPYLGPVKGFYTDWTPLTDRPGLFPEDIDTSDPWQFRNILVR